MYCGSWHRRLVSRIRSCAVKRGGGREKNKTQRTAKRYDDDGHGKDVGLRLLAACCCYYVGESASPQTNRYRTTTESGTGRKRSQLCVMYVYGAPLCAFNLLLRKKAL